MAERCTGALLPQRPGETAHEADLRRGAVNWPCVTGRAAPPLALLGGMVPIGVDPKSDPETLPLRRWARRVDRILDEIDHARVHPPAEGRKLVTTALAEARRETEADLAPFDELTRHIWGPLLLDPLRFNIAP